jgi:hypothetical protein
VRSLNVGWYRKQLSYVEQEPTLFNMTIAENIAFGPDGVSRAEIEAAAIQVWRQRVLGKMWLDHNHFSPLLFRQTLMSSSWSFARTMKAPQLSPTCLVDKSRGLSQCYVRVAFFDSSDDKRTWLTRIF